MVTNSCRLPLTLSVMIILDIGASVGLWAGLSAFAVIIQEFRLYHHKYDKRGPRRSTNILVDAGVFDFAGRLFEGSRIKNHLWKGQ